MVRIYFTIIFLFFTTNSFSKDLTIDLKANNLEFEKIFKINTLNINTKNNTLVHNYEYEDLYKSKVQIYVPAERIFKIKEFTDKGLVFTETFSDYFKFLHMIYSDDTYSIGSNYYNSKYKDLVNENGGPMEPWLISEFDIEKLLITETYWSKTKAVNKKEYSLQFDPEKFYTQQFINGVLFIATVYLYAQYFRNIKEVSRQEKINTPTVNQNSEYYRLKPANPYTPAWARSSNPFGPPCPLNFQAPFCRSR
jgi:hypothetical protein